MSLIRALYGDYLFILAILIIGILASTGLSLAYQQSWYNKVTEDFQGVARDRIELIRSELNNNNIVLRSVVSLFKSSDEVDRNEFTIFSDQVLQDHPYIQAIEWIPFVPGVDRSHFEEIARQDISGFGFRDRNEQGEMITAAPRDSYFPVYFVHPLENNRKVLGFDLSADRDRAEALQRARATRNIAATGAIHLLQTPDNGRGIIFVIPVFQTRQAFENEQPVIYERFTGMIATVVPLARMVESAIQPLRHAGVDIFIHDLSVADPAQQLLYTHETRLKARAQVGMEDDYKFTRRLTESVMLDVGGRKWQISVVSAHGYYKNVMQRESLIILLAGIMFTCLLVFYIFSRIRENEKIRSEVDERTRQLSHTKRQIEMILISTREGIIGLDDTGLVTFCNPMAVSLLGYSRKELIGASLERLSAGSSAPAETDIRNVFQDVCETETAKSVRNSLFPMKNGGVLEVEYTLSPIVDTGAITGAVLIFRDITQRRALERQLEEMARHDALTGLANRRLFTENLEQAILRARRSGRKIGVVFIDLNGFKPINDTLGHAAGDAVLKAFADRLKNIVRATDTIARFGGDEFTILVDDLADKKDCTRLIDMLVSNFDEPFPIAGQTFQMSGSIGLSFYPDNATTAAELLEQADAAMYAAKKDKSRQYVVFGDQGHIGVFPI